MEFGNKLNQMNWIASDRLKMEYSRHVNGGRPDFIGGIDNEALDFSHLESFIHVTNGTASVDTADSTAINGTPSHLPDSPPDSGTEPPYSPTDLHGLSSLAVPSSSATAVGPPASDLQSLTNLPTTAGSAVPVAVVPATPLEIRNVVVGGGSGGGLVVPNHHIISNPNVLYLRSDLNEAPTQMTPLTSPHTNCIGSGKMKENETATRDQQQLFNVAAATPTTAATLLDTAAGHHQQVVVTPYSNDIPTSNNLITLGSNGNSNPQSSSINPEELSRLIPIPDVYHSAIHSHHINRKRKLPTPSLCNPLKIVKPEPMPTTAAAGAATASLSPICQQTSMDCQTSSSSSPPTPICVGGIGSQLDTTTAAAAAAAAVTASTASGADHSSPNSESGDNNCPMQCIRFSPFQQQNWHIMCDQTLQELPLPHYRIDADKGFNFSHSDDAFVCQKKNHFQITCHAQLLGGSGGGGGGGGSVGTTLFVRTNGGLEKIKSFHLHFYGVKLETPTQIIRVEQSQSDRSKKPFYPVPIDLQKRQASKVTVGRLHFSETTSNNMRKKGRPNPEQRYFQLIVGLHAHTHSGHFPIISHGSEKIIVRASNPGQFESDVELCWQRGITQDSIYHTGRVGINTDRPDESFVIHGNVKISGHIVQPSDKRAKQQIQELGTGQQLENIQRIRVVKYCYDPEFAIHSGLRAPGDYRQLHDIGVIAQEIREILPDAVTEMGNLHLSNGQIIHDFLVVNKERIYLENIGAVQELTKITAALDRRIEKLEQLTLHFVNVDRIKLSGSPETKQTITMSMIRFMKFLLAFLLTICLMSILVNRIFDYNRIPKSLVYHCPMTQQQQHHRETISDLTNALKSTKLPKETDPNICANNLQFLNRKWNYDWLPLEMYQHINVGNVSIAMLPSSLSPQDILLNLTNNTNLLIHLSFCLGKTPDDNNHHPQHQQQQNRSLEK